MNEWIILWIQKILFIIRYSRSVNSLLTEMYLLLNTRKWNDLADWKLFLFFFMSVKQTYLFRLMLFLRAIFSMTAWSGWRIVRKRWKRRRCVAEFVKNATNFFSGIILVGGFLGWLEWFSRLNNLLSFYWTEKANKFKISIQAVLA